MNIGYACLALGVPGSEMKDCSLKTASVEKLLFLAGHNLSALLVLIDYNIRNGIKLFRISSDLIPFGSSLAAALPWREANSEIIEALGQKIRGSGMRVSMHPGQYTVLNSPHDSVVRRAVSDLEYHAKVLDSLSLGREHKIVLHIGGAYGDKKTAVSRFVSRYKDLSPAVRNRLVLENDDRLFTVEDALEAAAAVGAPVIYDNLHNAANPADRSAKDKYWIRICGKTWREGDGPQKIHYSSSRSGRRPGAHSESIGIGAFLEFIRELPGEDIDIMLEVKDKNISAIKCLNCASNRGIGALEADWARFKYSVLERSQKGYDTVRALLKDKSAYPAIDMYSIIEAALEKPLVPGGAVNAAQHVWGYFKDKASDSEKARFAIALDRAAAGEEGIRPAKNMLAALARKYSEEYLLRSYYFYI